MGQNLVDVRILDGKTFWLWDQTMSDIKTQAHPRWQPQEFFLVCLWNDPTPSQDDDDFLNFYSVGSTLLIIFIIL